jgi:hypothetical protein
MNEKVTMNQNDNPSGDGSSNRWPHIFDRYLQEPGATPEILPRRETKRFHGQEITGWTGKINVTDVEGYVENKRLKIYLNRWRNNGRGPTAVPTTDEMYQIMVDADAEEKRDDKKIFHIERIAQSICRNGVQEDIIVFSDGTGRTFLWDGNRRFFGTIHIMRSTDCTEFRPAAQWLPCFLIESSGDPLVDSRRKHAILTETNFVKKDSISWPTYVKAEEIWKGYNHRIAPDPADPTLRREVKSELAAEYGLKSWRQADRWIKMVDLAHQFKEYNEEEYDRDGDLVDLKIQDKFEYFDELSKPGVWGVLEKNPADRDHIFDWLWDDKFKSFVAVRFVPRILNDPVARDQANSADPEGVQKAIETVIANDPVRIKDKRGANAKVKQFAEWLDSFKREDFKQLDRGSLEMLKQVLQDVITILDALITEAEGQAA